jgi:hypothetical protein
LPIVEGIFNYVIKYLLKQIFFVHTIYEHFCHKVAWELTSMTSECQQAAASNYSGAVVKSGAPDQKEEGEK